MKGRRGYETRNEPEIEILGATVRIMGLQPTISASLDDTPNTEHVPSCGDCISAAKTLQKRSPSQRGGRPKAIIADISGRRRQRLALIPMIRVIETQY